MQGDFYHSLVFVQIPSMKESPDQKKGRDIGLSEVHWEVYSFYSLPKTLDLLNGQFLLSLFSSIPYVATASERLPDPPCSFMPRQNSFMPSPSPASAELS